MNFHRLIFLLSFISILPAEDQQPNRFEDLIGQWSGKGRIIVSWCDQEFIGLDIVIHDDQQVTGTIGDAVINNGRVKKNNWVLRMLGNPEFIIAGNLIGPLIESENIHRKSIHYLLLNMESGDILTGGFHSSGWHFGGRKKMVLSVTDITLQKQ